MMARLSEHGIRLSSMSPSYLESNSTSHTWPFSAVAELIDNASDPGVTAKNIWIDVLTVRDQLCLSFMDNGSGMTPSRLHKMLSFGFTEKGSAKGYHKPIGVYGNGFKSGSMRLGRDALIFTKNGGCQSVGLLSQSFLQAINAQAVIVPIAPFNQQTKTLVVTEDSEASLKAILKYSLFKTVSELEEQLDSIQGKKGTKIIIWNIRRNKDEKPEFDFDTDAEDIRLPEIQPETTQEKWRRDYYRHRRENHSTPEIEFSLRAYLSILYLKPRIQIILRQKKVQTKLVAKSLSMIENDVYKPQFINERVKITFGFNRKNKEHYGIMMYHKNRLIKAYEKVGCQIKSSGQRSGVGVIGVIECNFLKPAHNKQDFEYTKEYRLTLAALGLKLNDYWREKKEKKAKEREFQALEKTSKDDESEETEEEEEEEEEDEVGVSWIQCEECLKWRGISTHLFAGNIPDPFRCNMHPVARLRSCLLPEDTEENVTTPTYKKTLKKQEQASVRRRGRSLELIKSSGRHLCRVLSEPTSVTKQDEVMVSMEIEDDGVTATEEEESSPSPRKRRKETCSHVEERKMSTNRVKIPDLLTKRCTKTTDPIHEEASESTDSIHEEASTDPIHEEASESTDPIHEEASESTDPTHEEASEKTDPIYEEASEKTDPIHEEASKSTDPTHEEASESTDPIHEEASESTDSIHEAASKSTDPIHEAASKSTDPIHEAASESTDQIHKEASKSTDQIHKEASKSTDQIHKEASKSTDQIHKAASKSTDQIHKEASESTNQIHKEASESTDRIHKEASESTDRIHKEASESTDRIHKEASESTDRIHKEASKSTDQTHKEASESTNQIHKEASESTNQIHKEASESTDQIHKEASESTDPIHKEASKSTDPIHKALKSTDQIHKEASESTDQINEASETNIPAASGMTTAEHETPIEPQTCHGPPYPRIPPQPLSQHSSVSVAQTVVVTPLSRSGFQPISPLPTDNSDRAALTQRLAQLEREAKRLKRILGIHETPMDFAMVTEGSGSSDIATAEERPACADSGSCDQNDERQTNQRLDKQANSRPSQQVPEIISKDDLYWSKTCAKLQSENQTLLTDLNQMRTERDELMNQLRQMETNERRDQSTNTPSQTYNSTVTMERLRSIRRNVVALLSSILPNLDMQGISFDTVDVDSILQQIIQANNL
nr:MORC family CW-type zinc finger protein 3 [Misgurnus anguillicaudatus]